MCGIGVVVPLDMSAPIIVLSGRGQRTLVTVQSVLIGFQTIAAASILGDVIGPKFAALFIVVVAGAQQGVNYWANKSVVDAVNHVEGVVSRAEAISEVAHSATTEMAHTTATLLSNAVDSSKKE